LQGLRFDRLNANGLIQHCPAKQVQRQQAFEDFFVRHVGVVTGSTRSGHRCAEPLVGQVGDRL
jgi:hypothetical protein